MAYAQSLPHITMDLDRTVYGPGDTMRISGYVSSIHGGAVSIQIYAPNGNLMVIGQIPIIENRWNWDTVIDFKEPGTYEVIAHYTLSDSTPRQAKVTFLYDVSVSGIVVIEGTNLEADISSITYTGDIIKRVYTDPQESLIYFEFNGPSHGIMYIPDIIYEGDLIAVSGGMVTKLPEDGGFVYSTDGNKMILSADSVVIPEFGLTSIILATTLSMGVIVSRIAKIRNI